MEGEFRVAYLVFQCSACGHPRHNVKIGVSSLNEVVCYWVCQKCSKPMMVTMSFDQLKLYAPTHPFIEVPPVKEQLTAADLEYLRKMNITD
jgi:hypothetical protein